MTNNRTRLNHIIFWYKITFDYFWVVKHLSNLCLLSMVLVVLTNHPFTSTKHSFFQKKTTTCLLKLSVSSINMDTASLAITASISTLLALALISTVTEHSVSWATPSIVFTICVLVIVSLGETVPSYTANQKLKS